MFKTILTAVFVLFVYNIQGQDLFTPNKDYSFSKILKKKAKLKPKTAVKSIDDVTKKLEKLSVYNLSLNLNKATPQVTINLTDIETVTFTKTFSGFNKKTNVLFWQGIAKTKGGEISKISLETKDQVIGGYIQYTTNKVYQIMAIDKNNYLIEPVEIKEGDCSTDLFRIPDFSSVKKQKSAKKSVSTATVMANREDAGAYNCGNETAVKYIHRIVIAYTPQFAATFPAATRQAGINTHLENVLASVNLVYENSNMNIRARLAFSYQTADNEAGNKDTDFGNFESSGNAFDEIFTYREQYRADVSVLLVAANIGGRANRNAKMAIYGKSGSAFSNYGVAHEIGHLYDLEHNAEQFNWLQIWWNDFDDDGVCGYLGTNNRTVMSYPGSNGQRRRPLYSSPNLRFADGEIAGNNDEARARDWAQTYLGNVLQYNDQIWGAEDSIIINADQTVSQFAFQNWNISNYVVEPNAVASFKTTEYSNYYNGITLKSGIHFKAGSEVNLMLVPCNEATGYAKPNDSEVVAGILETPLIEVEINKDFTVFPNPAKEFFTIKKQFETKQSSIRLQIFDSFGRMIHTVDIKKSDALNTTINTYNYANGMYLIRVQADNYKETKKIIIKN